MNCPYSAPPISLDNRKVNGTGAADGKAKLYVLDIAANNPAIFTAEGFPPIFDWLRPTFGSKKLGWQPFQSLLSQLYGTSIGLMRSSTVAQKLLGVPPFDWRNIGKFPHISG
ncbi:MAG: hypothetical protein IM477_03450 [Microcystis sp. M090S1]|uniref:hypothetical protein n=1 Tax=Microcystis sp. M090S1 TaxID=2771135 RepID=UPI002589CE5E|nr:hypothetical protein [Microcystis sp. M090S1]MCA2811639.1 hypothetical protein [Microcystis sp. M090S1]